MPESPGGQSPAENVLRNVTAVIAGLTTLTGAIVGLAVAVSPVRDFLCHNIGWAFCQQPDLHPFAAFVINCASSSADQNKLSQTLSDMGMTISSPISVSHGPEPGAAPEGVSLVTTGSDNPNAVQAGGWLAHKLSTRSQTWKFVSGGSKFLTQAENRTSFSFVLVGHGCPVSADGDQMWVDRFFPNPRVGQIAVALGFAKPFSFATKDAAQDYGSKLEYKANGNLHVEIGTQATDGKSVVVIGRGLDVMRSANLQELWPDMAPSISGAQVKAFPIMLAD